MNRPTHPPDRGFQIDDSAVRRLEDIAGDVKELQQLREVVGRLEERTKAMEATGSQRMNTSEGKINQLVDSVDALGAQMNAMQIRLANEKGRVQGFTALSAVISLITLIVLIVSLAGTMLQCVPRVQASSESVKSLRIPESKEKREHVHTDDRKTVETEVLSPKQ